MKAGSTEKLTLVIETTNGNDISRDVMNSISSLQKTVASHKDMKLSMSIKEEEHNRVDQYSPAGWDYWPV